MIKGLNHIGIVVKSIDDTITLYEKLFGAVDITAGRHKSFPEIGQTSALIKIGDFVIELMEPYGDVKGTCAKFLERHGEGLHHISLISDDLDGDDEYLLSCGIHTLGKAPKDFPGDRVMFTHPKETNAVVFEITEPKEGGN